jgi:hypothetical protein
MDLKKIHSLLQIFVYLDEDLENYTGIVIKFELFITS